MLYYFDLGLKSRTRDPIIHYWWYGKTFPRAEDILNQKSEQISKVGEINFPKNFEGITKWDIESIDDSLRKRKAPKELMFLREKKRKWLRKKLNNLTL